MLLKVGLKLLAPIAVLHGVPESEIESFRGGFLGCRCRGTWRRERSCIEPCSGERGKGTFRILLEVGFHLGRAAVLDAVPKRELKGDLVVGGQLGDLRRSGRQFGYLSCLLGGRDLFLRRSLTNVEAKRPDRVRYVLDQLLAQIFKE